MAQVRFRNLRAFERELRSFGVDVVPERAQLLQRRIALELLRRIVLRTPVDTGRARGNWQVTNGPSTLTSVLREDQSGPATIAAGSVVINSSREFGVISIFNNVRYIRFLEMGSSAQARAGMVDVSLAEVSSIFSGRNT